MTGVLLNGTDFWIKETLGISKKEFFVGIVFAGGWGFNVSRNAVKINHVWSPSNMN